MPPPDLIAPPQLRQAEKLCLEMEDTERELREAVGLRVYCLPSFFGGSRCHACINEVSDAAAWTMESQGAPEMRT